MFRQSLLIFAVSMCSFIAYAEDAKQEEKSVVTDVKMEKKALSVLGAPACKMQENVTLSISFNLRLKSFAEAKKKFDDKMAQIVDFAKQQNISKFQLQSMNYNISSQPSNSGDISEQDYQMNGNVSYLLDSTENAFKLAEFLNQQKIQVNVSVNKYQNGMCGNGMGITE